MSPRLFLPMTIVLRLAAGLRLAERTEKVQQFFLFFTSQVDDQLLLEDSPNPASKRRAVSKRGECRNSLIAPWPSHSLADLDG